MESAEETAMGIAEARDRKRPCKADSILWRTLVLVRHQNVCQPSNLQRRAGKSRTYHGGVRGESGVTEMTDRLELYSALKKLNLTFL